MLLSLKILKVRLSIIIPDAKYTACKKDAICIIYICANIHISIPKPATVDASNSRLCFFINKKEAPRLVPPITKISNKPGIKKESNGEFANHSTFIPDPFVRINSSPPATALSP